MTPFREASMKELVELHLLVEKIKPHHLNGWLDWAEGNDTHNWGSSLSAVMDIIRSYDEAL